MGKLIEKLISIRMHFEGIACGIFHPSQFGGTQQHSTDDAGVFLTHAICLGWAQGKVTGTLAFDIAQFFPSLNHQVLTRIIQKAGFNSLLVSFFKSYLTGRQTRYSWNNFVSPLYNSDVGVGQGSALSPVLSSLYMSPAMWAFGKEPTVSDCSLVTYVDDGTVITQGKTFQENNIALGVAYRFIIGFLTRLGLAVEHDKTEIFHFSWAKNASNPPIDLGIAPFTGNTPLEPKKYWRYLGFFFDCKLMFVEHVCIYSFKSYSACKAMLMLGNSTRGLSPHLKCLLYISCVLLVITYGYCLWFYKNSPCKNHIKLLSKTQHQAALWITGAFRTSPTGGVET